MGIAERESFGCLEVFFWVRIAGREGLSWVWHLVKVSRGFEKSNDFSSEN